MLRNRRNKGGEEKGDYSKMMNFRKPSHPGLKEQKCYPKLRGMESLRLLLAVGAQLSEQEPRSLPFAGHCFCTWSHYPYPLLSLSLEPMLSPPPMLSSPLAPATAAEDALRIQRQEGSLLSPPSTVFHWQNLCRNQLVWEPGKYNLSLSPAL